MAWYNIVWFVYIRLVGFHACCLFVVFCIYNFISKLPSARPGFGGKLSHRAEDGVRVAREMRLWSLGYTSIGWIRC